jgi:hypothetical protein
VSRQVIVTLTGCSSRHAMRLSTGQQDFRCADRMARSKTVKRNRATVLS